MRKFIAVLVALGAHSATGGRAHAQAFRAPCHVDELCHGVQAGGGRIINCLREHKSQLSEECFAAIGHNVLNSHPRGPNSAAGLPTPEPNSGEPAQQ